MQPTSLLDLTEVPGTPRVKMTLPVPLRSGDRLRLAFRLRRQNNGRAEILDVVGEYRIVQATLTAENQILTVEAVGKAPGWRAIKKDLPFRRQLPPARFPPTLL